MATNTWNFPCYTCNDWGIYDMPGGTGGVRGAHGMLWAYGPEAGTTQPFTNTITGIFSFFLKSGWSNVSGVGQQMLASIGGRSAASWGMIVGLQGGGSGTNVLQIYTYDITGGFARHQVLLGDEDGINNLQPDKWYQCAFSISPTEFTYCINGSTTPFVHTVASDVNGDLNLDVGNDRFWYHCGQSANAGQASTNVITIQSGWPTYIVGAAAWSTTYVDWTDATARGRVFDANGDFKNPGENGSLWFHDTYNTVVPEYYFLDGSPRRNNGSESAVVPIVSAGGGAGSATCTGGLKKQYEITYPSDWWLYTSLAVAEASGDTWLDGDTIFIQTTGALFIYKASLAVSGYSGLIHKYPFGAVGRGAISAVSVKGSEAANTDPDAWTSSAATGVGTQGVDYEFDTNAGLSRMRDLTDAGFAFSNSNYTLTAADTETFRIIDQTSATTDTGTISNQWNRHSVRAYKDAGNYWDALLTAFSNEWNIKPAGSITGTGRDATTSGRIWLYINSGNVAAWMDDEGIPTWFATPNSASGASQNMSNTQCGFTQAGLTHTMNMGIDIFGSMTTS